MFQVAMILSTLRPAGPALNVFSLCYLSNSKKLLEWGNAELARLPKLAYVYISHLYHTTSLQADQDCHKSRTGLIWRKTALYVLEAPNTKFMMWNPGLLKCYWLCDGHGGEAEGRGGGVGRDDDGQGGEARTRRWGNQETEMTSYRDDTTDDAEWPKK